MHLNGIAKRITALALGAALLTATALPAFAEGTQQINVKYTYNAIDGTTWEKISHADFGTETNDGVVDYLGNGKVGPYVQGASTENNGDRGSPIAMLPRPMVIGSISAPCTAAWAQTPS